jgi:site-specific DNA-methyltransferase (adenine-specific)
MKSRIIYCAKSSKSERNAGCEELEEKKVDIQQPHNSKNLEERYEMKSVNNHPTVKPLKLMEYLCILTKTPTGGIVLDPYAGSGTTLLAAKKLKRPFIGIEKEKEYVKIARARLKGEPTPML